MYMMRSIASGFIPNFIHCSDMLIRKIGNRDSSMHALQLFYLNYQKFKQSRRKSLIC